MKATPVADTSSLEVKLRGVEDRDVAVFFDHQRDDRATAIAGVPTEDREPFCAHWSRIRADETVITRTITVGDGVVGNVVSWVEAGRREIGYWVDPELWGRGIASRAVTLFLVEVDERPLYAHVISDNLGSIRVLEKAGFRLVSRTRSADDGMVECRYELR
jgi:RimJ/RimL family protein N-acetyltransferase